MSRLNGRIRIQQERQARMELILNAAEKLFVDKGYGDTSINDIAEAADFSRTSIYQYFNSKEEIYVHILIRYTELLTERIVQTISTPAHTTDKIRAFLEELRAMIKMKPNFFALYFIQRHQVEPRLSPELKKELNVKRRKLEDVFRDFYRDGAAKGEVRNIRPKDASNLFFAQIMGMMLLHEYYGEEFDVTLDEHLDKSLEMYLEFVKK